MTSSKTTPYILYRSGSSKGPFFNINKLPYNLSKRNNLIM